MKFEHIILKKENGIATLILNRPERLNAVDERTFNELTEALHDVAKDPECRVLLITGAGRAFCAGGDVRREEERIQAELTLESRRQGIRRGPQAFMKNLYSLEIPTIAVVNGAAVGFGFDLALACDIRIGSENARFMVAFTRLGLVPGSGGTWLMPRVMGTAKAAELLFSGDFLEAQEAEKIGVLTKLVSAQQLEREATELARRIASQPPVALRLDKVLLHKGLYLDFESALEMVASSYIAALATEDHKEGIAAFREKRKPIFKGR